VERQNDEIQGLPFSDFPNIIYGFLVRHLGWGSTSQKACASARKHIQNEIRTYKEPSIISRTCATIWSKTDSRPTDHHYPQSNPLSRVCTVPSNTVFFASIIFFVTNPLDIEKMMSMLLTVLFTFLAFSVSESLDFPCTAHIFLPERLSNDCQGLRLTFSEIRIQFDAVSLSDPS
jgi:hypothetical protein